METYTKSELFSVYNKYRAMARRYGWDMKRVNRAFGILLSKKRFEEKMKEYQTQLDDPHHVPFCGCSDFKYRIGPHVHDAPHTWCKHQFALEMYFMILERRTA